MPTGSIGDGGYFRAQQALEIIEDYTKELAKIKEHRSSFMPKDLKKQVTEYQKALIALRKEFKKYARPKDKYAEGSIW